MPADEFSLSEARATLAILRDLAPDGLRAPLSRGDLGAILVAGIEVKSVDQGLLDFPTYVDGSPAYWCWRAGEPSIEWWHPRDSGFSGRRSILDLPSDYD